ncbi:MAG: flagellar motor switch protein FliM [Firmicutes bacterium]|nr:flagellar motor switch protein FliM [Bacillota bacterium]
MAEVLSQNEIDALLNALTTGELTAEEIRREDEQGRIRVYDFKRALRFSKEHLRTISRIYEHMARLLSTYYSSQLRSVVQIGIASVEQLPYEEFMRSIPAVTVLHVLDVQPLGGKFLMEIPTNLSHAMLDRLFGGNGTMPVVDRRLTEIDMIVLERLVSGSLRTLSSAWSGVAELEFNYEAMEVNPQFVQIASQTDVVLVVSLSLAIGGQSGIMTFCMPHVALEPLMSRLSARFAMSAPKAASEANLLAERLEKHMDRVEVWMKVELGYAAIRVDELLDLHVGDMITLEQSVGDPLFIKVGEELKYRGQPGVHRGRYAARIEQTVEEGVENE